MTAIDIVRFEQRLLRSSAGLGDAYEADTCIVCASFCVNRPDFSRDSMTGFWPAAAFRRSPFSADSVEKVGSAAAGRSGVPAVEVAGSHFKLPLGTSLSVLAQV
ncbi:hypothetical protein [Stutzerimonas stutzeri]|uniref:hypothetical protein n=1 Tax=Stutzerimonas stutzeri TaxID=316 RepID=UPI000F6CF004|nr:hypothetical protein [Stutzerimonas stutzeri]AZL50094.1 hypothetical protein CXB48_21615 [Stutzerimonas stutzeri]